MTAAQTGSEQWAQALAWADELAALALIADDPHSWDHRATAGIIATTAYTLARHDQLPQVRALGLDRLIYPLFDEDAFATWAAAELAAAGHNLNATMIDPADPVVTMWAWLTKRWPADEDGESRAEVGDRPPRWSLGGRCAPRPATEIYLLWAGAGVNAALSAERGALPRRATVVVTGGPWAGEHGFLENPAWLVDHGAGRVVAGPPGAYMVNLGQVPNTDRVDFRVERVLTEHLVLDADNDLS